MSKKQPDIVRKMFGMQVDRMLSGRKMSPGFYKLIRHIGHMAGQAVRNRDASRNFTALRTDMNRAYFDAYRAAGIDPVNPIRATAEIGFSRGKIVVHLKDDARKSIKRSFKAVANQGSDNAR
ncbi:MAG TPA: hypothetical protein VJQ54_09725 [Candidatus Sulfotelmatobacter sp.]|nr:hypothetical protein [Candidatus Sulfotelmatobacter sp.]